MGSSRILSRKLCRQRTPRPDGPTGRSVSWGVSGGTATTSTGAASQGISAQDILSPLVRMLQTWVLILGVSDSPLSQLGMLGNLPVIRWLVAPLDAIFQIEFMGGWVWAVSLYPLLLLSNAAGAISVELGDIERVPPLIPALLLWAMLVGFGAALVLMLVQDRRELREVCTPEDILDTINKQRYDNNDGEDVPPAPPLLQVPSPPPTGVRGLLALSLPPFTPNPMTTAVPPTPLPDTSIPQTPQSLIGMASQFQRLGAAGRTVAAMLYTDATLPDLPQSFNWLRQSRLGTAIATSSSSPSITASAVVVPPTSLHTLTPNHHSIAVAGNTIGLASLALSMGSPALRHAAIEAARGSHVAGQPSRWSVPSAPLLSLQVRLGKLEVAPPTMGAPRESTAHLPSLGPLDETNVEGQVAEELEWRLQMLGGLGASSATIGRNLTPSLRTSNRYASTHSSQLYDDDIPPLSAGSSNTFAQSQSVRSSVRSSVLRASLEDAEHTSVFRVAFSTPLSVNVPPPINQSTVAFRSIPPMRAIVGPGRYGVIEEDSDEDAVEQAAAGLVRLEGSSSSLVDHVNLETTMVGSGGVSSLEPLRSSGEPILRPKNNVPPTITVQLPPPPQATRPLVDGGFVVLQPRPSSYTTLPNTSRNRAGPPQQHTHEMEVLNDDDDDQPVFQPKVSKAKLLKMHLERKVLFQVPEDTVLWRGPRSLLQLPPPFNATHLQTESPLSNTITTTALTIKDVVPVGIMIFDQVALSDVLLVSIRTRKEGLQHVVTHHNADLDRRQLSVFGCVDTTLDPLDRVRAAFARNGHVLHTISWQLHVGREVDRLITRVPILASEASDSVDSAAVDLPPTTPSVAVLPSAFTVQLVVEGDRVGELMSLSGARASPPQDDPMLPPTPLGVATTATLIAKHPTLEIHQSNRCPTHGCRLVLATRSHVVAQDILRDITQRDPSHLLFKCAYHGPRGFTFSRFQAGDRRKKLLRRAGGVLGRFVSRAAAEEAPTQVLHESVCPGGDNMKKTFYVCPFVSTRNSQFKSTNGGGFGAGLGDGEDPFCCRYAVCNDCFMGSSLYATIASYVHFVLHYVGYRYFFGFLLLAIAQILLLPALRDAWKVLLCPTTSVVFQESSKASSIFTSSLSNYIQQASFCLSTPSSMSLFDAVALTNTLNATTPVSQIVVSSWTLSDVSRWGSTTAGIDAQVYTSNSVGTTLEGISSSSASPLIYTDAVATHAFIFSCALLVVTLIGGGLCIFVIRNLFGRKQLFLRHAVAITLSYSSGNTVLATHLERDALDAQYQQGDRSLTDAMRILWRRLKRVIPLGCVKVVSAISIKGMTVLDPPQGSSDDEVEPYVYDGPPRALSRLRGASVTCGRGLRWVRGGWVHLAHRLCAPLPWDRWSATLHRLDFSLTKSMYEHTTFRHMVVLQAITYILTKWVVAVVLGATSSDVVLAAAFEDVVKGPTLGEFHTLLNMASNDGVGYAYRIGEGRGLAVVGGGGTDTLPALLSTSFGVQHALLEQEAAASLSLIVGTALLEMAMSVYVQIGHVYGSPWVSLVVRLSSAHQLIQLGFTATVGALVYEERGRYLREILQTSVQQFNIAYNAQLDLISSVYVGDKDASFPQFSTVNLHAHNTSAYMESISDQGVTNQSLLSQADEVGETLKKASAIVFIVYLGVISVTLVFAFVLPALRAVMKERQWRREQREAAVEKGLTDPG